MLREHPELGAGVHLTLTAGDPLLAGHRTLADADGHFHRLSFVMENPQTLDPGEIELEFSAQIDRVIAAGIHPTHLDSHHHVHGFDGIDRIFVRMCKKYGLSARMIPNEEMLRENGIKTTQIFSADFYSEQATIENLLSIIERNERAESLEIMCHPAYLDQRLLTAASYNLRRTHELEVLTSERLKDAIRGRGITLCGFAGL